MVYATKQSKLVTLTVLTRQIQAQLVDYMQTRLDLQSLVQSASIDFYHASLTLALHVYTAICIHSCHHCHWGGCAIQYMYNACTIYIGYIVYMYYRSIVYMYWALAYEGQISIQNTHPTAHCQALPLVMIRTVLTLESIDYIYTTVYQLGPIQTILHYPLV